MPDERSAEREAPCGLLVDWGGVLTTNVFESFEAFCLREGSAGDAVRDAFRADPRAHELLVGLEIGTLADADFEKRFAELLGVAGDGLIARLMAGTRARHRDDRPPSAGPATTASRPA